MSLRPIVEIRPGIDVAPDRRNDRNRPFFWSDFGQIMTQGIGGFSLIAVGKKGDRSNLTLDTLEMLSTSANLAIRADRWNLEINPYGHEARVIIRSAVNIGSENRTVWRKIRANRQDVIEEMVQECSQNSDSLVNATIRVRFLD